MSAKTKRYDTHCVDIEGLVTDYLGLTVVYENIAEDDPNKIAFLSNGKRPLLVFREGKRVQVVFSKNTAVLDKVLLKKMKAAVGGLRSVTKAHTALLPNRILCRMWDVFITNSIPKESTPSKNEKNYSPFLKPKQIGCRQFF